jgi:hypothetical protein
MVLALSKELYTKGCISFFFKNKIIGNARLGMGVGLCWPPLPFSGLK